MAIILISCNPPYSIQVNINYMISNIKTILIFNSSMTTKHFLDKIPSGSDYIARHQFWGGSWSVLGFVCNPMLGFVCNPMLGFVCNLMLDLSAIQCWDLSAIRNPQKSPLPPKPPTPQEASILEKIPKQFKSFFSICHYFHCWPPDSWRDDGRSGNG